MKLHSSQYTLVFILLCMVLCRCSPEKTSDLTQAAIIPKPLFVEASGKNFILDRSTVIYVPNGDDGLVAVAQRLASQINLATGFTNVIEMTEKEPDNGIFLQLESENDWANDEAYVLAIQTKRIVVHTPTVAGAFNGIQTLVQLIPFGSASPEYLIPTGTIRDYPQYAWRGAMLDVARHFFSVDDVKRYIDLISYYKINTLHLHLTDD